MPKPVKELNVILHPKQQLAYEHLTNRTTKILGYGGAAGGGKTWLGVFWLISMCLGYANTRWFISRRRINILEKSTLVSFHKFFLHYGLKFDQFCKYNSNTHTIVFNHTGSTIDLIAAVELASDPDNNQFGSIEYTGGWFEEAHETPKDIAYVLSTRVGRHANKEYGIRGKILKTFNPGQSYIKEEFYEPFRKTGRTSHSIYDSDGHKIGDSVFIQAMWSDNPDLSKDYVDNLKSAPEAERKRLLDGDWDYEEAPGQLIKFEWLDLCESVDHIEGEDYLGVDVNRGGADFACIARFNGNKLMSDLWIGGDLNPLDLATKLETDYIFKLGANPNNIAVDVIGVGSGTADMLDRDGLPIYEFVSGGVPEEIASGLTDAYYTKHLRFLNIRAQAYWLLMEDIKDEKICLGTLPRELSQELLSIRYVITDKKIKLIPKDEIRTLLGRSPDRADAVVMANFMRHISSGVEIGLRILPSPIIDTLLREAIEPFYHCWLGDSGLSVTNTDDYNVTVYKEIRRIARDSFNSYVLAFFYNDLNMSWEFIGFNRNLGHIVCIGKLKGISYNSISERLILLARNYMNNATIIPITKSGDTVDTVTGIIMKNYRLVYNSYDNPLEMAIGNVNGAVMNIGYVYNLESMRIAEEAILAFVEDRELTELPTDLVMAIRYYIKTKKITMKSDTESLVVIFGVIAYYDSINKLKNIDYNSGLGQTGQGSALSGTIFDKTGA